MQNQNSPIGEFCLINFLESWGFRLGGMPSAFARIGKQLLEGMGSRNLRNFLSFSIPVPLWDANLSSQSWLNREVAPSVRDTTFVEALSTLCKDYMISYDVMIVCARESQASRRIVVLDRGCCTWGGEIWGIVREYTERVCECDACDLLTMHVWLEASLFGIYPSISSRAEWVCRRHTVRTTAATAQRRTTETGCRLRSTRVGR